VGPPSVFGLQQQLGNEVILGPIPVGFHQLVGDPFLTGDVDVEEPQRHVQPLREAGGPIRGEWNAMGAPGGQHQIQPDRYGRHGCAGVLGLL
jgi:hypothetical protein